MLAGLHFRLNWAFTSSQLGNVAVLTSLVRSHFHVFAH